MSMASTVKKAKYTYTQLNDVRLNSKVNTYGVIKFLKQPYKSRGSDYCLVLNLVDESCDQLDQGLKCLLFARQEDLLPVGELGDVVRFHRLAISEFRGSKQGQSSPGFSWLLFSGDAGSPLEPVKASSATYQLSDEDKEQVQRLRDWTSGKQELVERLSTFHNVGANCYFDLVCQVVSVAVVDPGVCQLLRVWDGTRTIYNAHSMKKEDSEKLDIDTDILLEERAAELQYDVFVYDNHVQTASKVKPGDYVKFINLHASEHKNNTGEADNQSSIASLEFILHRGNSFGRGIRVLSPDGQAVKSLIQRLDRFCLPQLSSDTDFTFMNSLARTASESSQTAGDNSGNTSNVLTNRSTETGGESSKTVGDKSNASVNKSAKTGGETSRAIGVKSNASVNKSTKMGGETSRTVGDDSKRSTSVNKSAKTRGETSRTDGHESNPEVKDEPAETGDDRGSVTASDTGGTVGDRRRSSEDEVTEVTVTRGQAVGLLSSGQRCMLQTKTVVLNHPHVKRSTVGEVLRAQGPGKFRVCVRVGAYHPTPESPAKFLKLYCSICQHLCDIPSASEKRQKRCDSQLAVGSSFSGVPHYLCPQCFSQRSDSSGLDSPPHLSYIFMLRFLLKDDTGVLIANIWRSQANAPIDAFCNAGMLLRFLLKDDTGVLIANIWRSEAITFFKNIEPVDVVQDWDQFSQVCDMLRDICPRPGLQETSRAAEKGPWVECCLNSYTVNGQKVFQIFDTAIV